MIIYYFLVYFILNKAIIKSSREQRVVISLYGYLVDMILKFQSFLVCIFKYIHNYRYSEF